MSRKLESSAARRIAGFLVALELGLQPRIVLAEVRSPFSPASPQATAIANLFWLIVAIAGIIFVGVGGAIIYATFAFRQRPGRTAAQFTGNLPIEVAWTTVPLALLIVIFYLTVRTMVDLQVPTFGSSSGDPVEITVAGHQWWWQFTYPAERITTANEFHVPVGEPVILHLKSDNVIHSFWIPEMNGKLDLIPGHDRTLWFTPAQTGVFLGQCAEFCGIQHAWMQIRLVVQTPAEYAAWVREQQRAAVAPTGLAAQGQQIFMQQTCPSCHTIAGTTANGIAGPDLTHVASRATLGAGVLLNTPQNMERWLRNPQDVKPGNLMPNSKLTEEQVRALTAYMESLR